MSQPATGIVPARHWADLTTEDFSQLDLSRAIAVLPLGATEQHGPHLPLNVDSTLVSGIVQAALPLVATGCPVLFLPVQAVGLSPEHAAFAGTLTLRPETVIRLWTDMAESVRAAGINTLVLFNAHGGHVGIMDVLARDLRARLGMLVYSVNWFGLPLLGPDGADLNTLFSPEEHRFGVHGGEVETSMMLALSPHQVHMHRAQYFRSSSQHRAEKFDILGNGKSAKLAWQMQDLNPHGAAGQAQAATADKGQQLVQAAARGLARLLGEIEQLPTDTLSAHTAFRP